jgi:lysophospholipase L1-like esterase
MKIVTLFLAVFLFLGCSKSKQLTLVDDNNGKNNGPINPNIVNAKPGEGNIFVVGDSLAFGTGANEFLNSPAGCLAAEFSPSTVANMATPGLTSKQVLNQVQFFISPPPKLVFISSGGNDALADYYSPGSYPSSNSIIELRSMIEQFQKVGALVSYLKIDPPYDSEASKRLLLMAQEAEKMGVIVIDGMAGLWNTNKMSDEFHPNDEGYKIMCEKMSDAISPYFP